MEMSRVLALILALTMVFTVLAAFPVGASAASMADDTFFAKLDYQNNPDLSAVKTAVDKRDYETAKEELLKYFKNRHEADQITGNGVTVADENYGMAVLPMRNILTGPYEFDMWQGEFTVTSSESAPYSVDVTDRIADQLDNGAVSFMLMAGEKQRFPVIVKSKEAGEVGPKLVIELGDGTEKTIAADQDTFISSEATTANNGAVEGLYVKEDDDAANNSTGKNTRRAYINFPLGDVADSEIAKATLVVNAAYAADCDTGDKDVLVINIGDTVWKEGNLNWSGIRGNIFSYQNLTDPIWKASAPNADGEYHNVTGRFWFGKPMAYEYLSYLELGEEAYNASHPYHEQYPGADFGPKLVDLMDAFATQMNYGWPRTLETGERLNRWVDIVDALLGTDVFDDKLDEFVNILSFMWGDCNYLNGLDITKGDVWWSNWRIVANAGFFKAVEFLPELKDHDKFREKVEYNVEYTLDLLYNDDMSFTEAGPSYAEWCVKLFGDCLIAAEKSGNPMSNSFKTKLTYAARSAAQSFFPDGWDSNVGDSNYRDKMPEFKLIAEYLNDPVLNAYVNGADDPSDAEVEGAKSVLYDDSNSVYMRTSWNPAETTYVSFVNNPSDGHAHPDSNQVLMYAYGQPLLVDSGRYSYSSTNEIYDKLRWSQAHNTVEAEGVSMGVEGENKNYHSNSAEKISTYADNDMFTFATSTQHGYPNTKHTRNVLFLKNLDGLTLVTDYVDGNNASQVYRQNWHFMPSNNAKVDGNTVSTNFSGKANVDLYNADSDAAAEIKDGYFSADYGLVAGSQYGSFKKTGEDVKFGTVIVPRKAGEAAANLTVTDGAKDINSSAVSVTGDRNLDFYVKNTDTADGNFGEYTVDTKAKMAFAGDGLYGLVGGKTLKKGEQDIISSELELASIAVSAQDGAVAISGENLTPTTDKAQAIKIYAGSDAKSVTLNGEDIEFTKDGDYVYAVGVGSVTIVEETEYKAVKDGFEAYSSTGDGVKNRTYIQAANSWQNRNAYMGFDLTDVDPDSFDKAELRLTMITQSDDDKKPAGILHFYFLDYGEWTRETVPFILDETKMPTMTTGTTGGYLGKAFHFTGDGNSVNSDGAVLNIDFTSQLKEYLKGTEANGTVIPPGEPKFTLAMLSESGSRKFASLENTTYPGPAIVLSTSKTEGEKKETKVNVTFTDEDGTEIADAVEVTTGLTDGKLYTYGAPETITYNDVTYYLDEAQSYLSVMIKEGNSYQLKAKYVPAAEIKVQFTNNGEIVSQGESVFVMPGSSYTYSPDVVYILNDQGYVTDTEKSLLTVKADGESTVTVALAKADITEIPITNGSFEEGLDGWYSVGTDNLVQTNGGGVQSTEQKYDGDYSYKQQTGGDGTSGKNLYGQFPLGDVQVGDQYILAFRRYGGDSITLTTGLNNSSYDVGSTVPANSFVDESCGGLGNSDKSPVNCNLSGLPVNQWHQLAYTLTAGANSKCAVVYARWCGGQYFDDFHLYKVANVEIKTATVTVKYVDAEGRDVRTAETFEARVGDSYNVESYVIDSFRGNSNLYTYNADATKGLTGTVAEDTVINIVYDAAPYDGILLDLSFDDEETGFVGGLGKAQTKGESVLADGKLGKALSLDGKGTNWLDVTLADGGSLLANVEEMTVSYYSKVTNTATNWPFFAAANAAAPTNQFEHYLGVIENGGITVERYANNGSRPANPVVQNTGAEWKLVTVVVSKGSTEVYIDGKLKATQASDYSMSDVLGSKPVLQIGKANWGAGEFFNGLIDQFRIYDHALTAQEVAALAVPSMATETGLRILTNEEDGSTELGISFTTTLAEGLGTVEKAGFEYGAYADDGNGNYTVQKTDTEEVFEALSGNTFRLTITKIKPGNVIRLYAARPYVIVEGKKIYGETVAESLFNALADSIANGKGATITPARLTAANAVLTTVVEKLKKGETETKFPGFAEAYKKLFNDDGSIKEQYAKLGLKAGTVEDAYAETLSLETVSIEFVDTDITESVGGDMNADLDFLPEL